MEAAHSMISILTIILASIELSAQFDCLPNGDPISSIFLDESSHPASTHPAEKFVRVRSKSPAEFRSLAKPPGKCMVQPTTIEYSFGSLYRLDQLESFRLTANKNLSRLFHLQKYTFPHNASLRILARNNLYVAIPDQEHIVLSTSNGDVFAIMDNSCTFAGIYGYLGNHTGKARAKMNIVNGKITILTKDEIREVPVGRKSKISLNYRVERVNHGPQH